MATLRTQSLSTLYEQDETAWLEAMAKLAAQGRLSEMDHPHLSEYLADMANRDRREVFSRLVVRVRRGVCGGSAECGWALDTILVDEGAY